jgi:hypothetical protein
VSGRCTEDVAEELEALTARVGQVVATLEPDRLSPAVALRVLRAFAGFAKRRPAVLQTALEARAVRRDGDVYCDEDGCDQRLGLEWDHERPVSARGPTSYENLKPSCRPHHRDKTERDRRRSRSPAARDP